MPPTTREEIPPGTLDLLILKTLDRHERLHGFEIANAIQTLSQDVLQVEEGSLYPALQRMLFKDWLTGEWGKTAENRRARYYEITKDGRKHLTRELARYGRVSEAIGRILSPA
jgi:PadR family transcriptional regulator